MGGTRKTGISRREFARRAALVSAASFVPPTTLSAAAPAVRASPREPSLDGAALSAESQAETEARYQTILKLYGSRLSDAQKADLQRLSVSGQQALDRIRAYHLENSDNPALYLKPLVEREKKPASSTAPASAPAAKKP